MNTSTTNAPFERALQDNLQTIKKLLPSEDILTYEFETADKLACALVYADGIVNKELLDGDERNARCKSVARHLEGLHRLFTVVYSEPYRRSVNYIARISLSLVKYISFGGPLP